MEGIDMKTKLKKIVKNWSIDGISYIDKFCIEDNTLYKEYSSNYRTKIDIDNLTRSEIVKLDSNIKKAYPAQYK